ncbi:hypothetical protein SRB5_60790 [Streptomyces sp. RB5]|uniref:Uncharacterized protein n=1 Tax=Streptomyces smaragdinus TaxID=2585196 RepID=A0A7K0CQX2_9ACTN|nr:hypothetical protein [Streptomyces smaragdinus]MQY15887.1 hypothetical protein [Streptomyces smaragdinus]
MGKGKKRRNQEQQHQHTDRYAVDPKGRAERTSQGDERSAERSQRRGSSPEVDDFAHGPEHYEGR